MILENSIRNQLLFYVNNLTKLMKTMRQTVRVGAILFFSLRRRHLNTKT